MQVFRISDGKTLMIPSNLDIKQEKDGKFCLEYKGKRYEVKVQILEQINDHSSTAFFTKPEYVNNKEEENGNKNKKSRRN